MPRPTLGRQKKLPVLAKTFFKATAMLAQRKISGEIAPQVVTLHDESGKLDLFLPVQASMQTQSSTYVLVQFPWEESPTEETPLIYQAFQVSQGKAIEIADDDEYTEVYQRLCDKLP